MYSSFQLAKKYIYYYFTAANGKGHGIHSPFVYEFISKVLNDRTHYRSYKPIENRRKQLLQDSTTIEVNDFGAGSALMKCNNRQVKKIAATSLKSKKYAQLLFRIVQYYQPSKILELGTSLGITSCYLAAGNHQGELYTCEGADTIAAIARQNFDQLQLANVRIISGDFAKTLPALLQQIQRVDLAFIDGNHRKEPTLSYFSGLLPYTTPATILIFDDIHWSEEMEAAWAAIQRHPAVTLTIDLFFIGLVFVNPDFKVKQHFVIRY